MCTQDIDAYKEGKREALHHKQRVMHRNATDLNKRVDISANLGAGASNADDIRCSSSKRLNRGSVAQPTVQGNAQHRERRASVDERVSDKHSCNRGGRKDLRGAFAC